MTIIRSEGVTRTERILKNLCENSFMRLWSYPNPFRDDGDELCDLIVIFENKILIFADRENRTLKVGDENLDISWGRWKKKTIDAQIRSIRGAERYLKSERSLYLDDKQNSKFPIDIDIENAKIFKIIVAHGARDACQFSSPNNVSGSLGITYSNHSSDMKIPFMIDLESNDPIHVLDSQNLEIIMRELDTINDFVPYLEAKEEAISKFNVLAYCGEEDLLADYLQNYNKRKQKHYIGTKKKNINYVAVAEGAWQNFTKSKPYLRKKEADSKSYLWDKLIQRTGDFALKGQTGGNANPFKWQSAIVEMAKEPRFMRRVYSQRISSAINKFPIDAELNMRMVTLLDSYAPTMGYVFLQIQYNPEVEYEKYRELRRGMLEIACASAKLKLPKYEKVVGIAVEPPKLTRNISEDFLILDCSNWDSNTIEMYENANNELQFFKSLPDNLQMYSNSEFPPLDSHRKIGRNQKCYCGSNLKFKHCHGKSV